MSTTPALASTISVDGIPRDNGAVDIALGAGPHEVCFAPVAGHSPPPCQRLVTAAGATSMVTGTFDAPTSYAYNGDGLRMSATLAPRSPCATQTTPTPECGTRQPAA